MPELDSNHPRIPLKLISTPAGHMLSAPPVLIASTHTIHYTCGQCGIVLMHAEDAQVHNLTICCKKCGSFNSTDA